ncbi:HEAT repeat domain-containing protein, partial [Bacteroidota bacterium]
ALGALGSEKIINIFLEKLSDNDLSVYVRSDMIDVLGNMSLQWIIDPLIKIFNNKEVNPIVRRRITNAFAKIKSLKTIKPLTIALGEDDQSIREGAVYALGKIDSKESIELLLNLLNDDNKNVSRTANSSLRTLRPDLKVDLLLASIEDEWMYISEGAIIELSALGETVLEKLHKEIQGKNDHFRWQVLRILSRIKSEKSVNLFLELISDKNQYISNECAVGLAGIRSEESISPLIQMLNSESLEIQETVSWILGEIRHDEAVKPLIKLLKNEKSAWFAAMSLGKLGNNVALKPLKKLSKSKINVNRQAAIWAIERINQSGEEQIPYKTTLSIYDNSINYPLYPELLEKRPDIPSPVFTADGNEYIVGSTQDKKFTIFPVTLVNNRDKNKEWWEKGRQLEADKADFPTLFATGLHSDIELDFTKSITGRSISEITYLARPDMSSGIGFIAKDEDIISVLKGDNHLIQNLGLTQPDIIRPFFHVWNSIIEGIRNEQLTNARSMREGIFYNKNFIQITAGGRGFQESILNDEIKGALHLEMWRELDNKEKKYIYEKYPHLSDEEMKDMINKLSHIHTGEMVCYYARWYGFYEGHTGYRADPIAIAFIFGLKSIEEIEKAFPGEIYKVLTTEYINNE